jgi:hypothetical protein
MADVTKISGVAIELITKIGPKAKSAVKKIAGKEKPTAGAHIFSSGEYVLSEASSTHTGVLVLVTTSGVNSLEQPSGGIPKYRINTITVTPNLNTANTFDIAINGGGRNGPQVTEAAFSGTGNGSTLSFSVAVYNFIITYTA